MDDRSHPWVLPGDISLLGCGACGSHSGTIQKWGLGTSNLSPTLSSSLPPGCCAWSSPCVFLLYSQREQSRVADEPSLSPGPSGMAQGSLCLSPAKCLGVGSSPTVCAGFWGVPGQWEACGDPGKCCRCLRDGLDGFQRSNVFNKDSWGCWALPGATPQL